MKRVLWISFLLVTVGLLASDASAQSCCGLSTAAAESLREMCEDGSCESPITPGTSTVTGCQNRVMFGDNSSVLNCEAALTYTASTDTLAPTIIALPAGNAATPSINFGTANTGIYAGTGGAVSISANGGEKFRCTSTPINGCDVFGTLALSSSVDVLLTREAAGVFQLGEDVNGAAIAQTVKAHDGITGTDVAGPNLTTAAGRGTGAGTVGDLISQTATALGTGTTAQALVTRQHIEGGFRTLTDATATTVFTVTLGNDINCGGQFFFSVRAADATNEQNTTGSVNFSAVDTTAGAGGEACSAAVTGTNSTAASAGTLTVTADATTGTDLCNIRLTASGSLTETVGPRARYSIVFNPDSSTCAVTPQ